MILDSWGPLGKGLGALLGRLGGLLGRLEAVLGVLGSATRGPLGPSWGPEKVMRQDAPEPRGDAGSPGRVENLGSGPLIIPQD